MINIHGPILCFDGHDVSWLFDERVLGVAAVLEATDADGFPVTDLYIDAPPVINVLFNSTAFGDADSRMGGVTGGELGRSSRGINTASTTAIRATACSNSVGLVD